MKSKFALVLAGATLAITGATLPASAFERHTPTLNFAESGLSNTIGQQDVGGNQETLLLAQKGGTSTKTPKKDDGKREDNKKGEWKLDKSKATFKRLTPAEQAKFDAFQNAIVHQGMSPKDAAAKIGGADFKVLNEKTEQYQIRLSQANRVTFLIDNTNHTVKILQVGGHT